MIRICFLNNCIKIDVNKFLQILYMQNKIVPVAELVEHAKKKYRCHLSFSCEKETY